MPRHLRRSLLLLVLLAGWLAACYAVRYGLMEAVRWVAECDGSRPSVLCDLRSTLGLLIHFQVMVWVALACTVPAFFLAGRRGRGLAWLGLFLTAPALALYTVTPAVVSALIGALRLVRDERSAATTSAATSSAEAEAQPSA